MATLVIGYGNPLRQDDGLGWHVAERLGSAPSPGVEVIACHQLTPELAEPISRARRVVFVDALRGRTAGRIRCRAVAPEASAAAFSHHVAPGALLALARALYGGCPPAWVVTVEGVAFDHGANVSPAVAAAVEVAVARIRELVRDPLDRPV
jgi:hydrogenase maturation protease